MDSKHKQLAAAMGRYRRKLELGAKIYAAMEGDQTLTLTDGAKLFGVSRQRFARLLDWYIRERRIIEMRRQDREAKKATTKEIASK